MDATTELAEHLSRHTGVPDVYQHPEVENFYYSAGVRTFLREAGHGAAWLRDLLAWSPQVSAGVCDADKPCMVTLLVSEGRALLTVCELLELKPLCGDKTAQLVMPKVLFFGCEIEDTDCPPGAWIFKLMPFQNGIVMFLPNET